MRPREFLRVIGGAAAWPVVARAQQAAMPVVGFLSQRAPNDAPQFTAAFRQGLKNLRLCRGSERLNRISVRRESN